MTKLKINMATKEPEKITGKKTEVIDRSLKRGNVQGQLAALKLHVESEKFLQRKRERTKYKEAFDEVIGKVSEALTTAKQKIDGMIDTASPSDIAAFTNAWKAWKGGNLESYLAPQYRTARQLWRTEMVAYISGKLVTGPRADKSVVMEKIMEAVAVIEFEDDPAEALKTAMHIDSKIKGLAVRKEIAKKMEKSNKAGDLNSIGIHFPSYGFVEMKVVVGGEFLVIPPDQAANFKFMRMVLDEKENRIYAQMENGCRGNLVIIELTPPAGVREGTGRTRVPPKPQVPEGSARTPVPQRPAPAPAPEGAGRTVVPPPPQAPEGSGRTTVPQRPAPPPERGESDDAYPPPEEVAPK